MGFKLYPHQKLAVDQLKTGSILCGGVGSGKSLTALVYFFTRECGGVIYDERNLSDMKTPKDLYIITTAAKRDTLDWERECSLFPISRDRSASLNGIQLKVDSWNNIKKYTEIKNCFFIFDEQRLVGSGVWVKSFLKIVKSNSWILLTATPGDTWMDYIPVFIANGYFKNRTEFLRKHVVYNTFTKYPKVDRYVEEAALRKMKFSILVTMNYLKKAQCFYRDLLAEFDLNLFDLVYKKRWNPFTNLPIKDIGEYCYILRKVVNSDPSRLDIIKNLRRKHNKVIVFYNFDYELEILRSLKKEKDFLVSEYNGHFHEEIPKSNSWIYLVQYMAGAEGWNCVQTDTMIFYSLNYSYRMMVQAAGRIDRLNTPYLSLFYYRIKSKSKIDLAISSSLANKKTFNEHNFSNFA